MNSGVSAGLVVLWAVCGAAVRADARVLYEGFGYQEGVPLSGQNGGSGGWASPWIPQGGFTPDTVGFPGLAYSRGGELATTPGSAMAASTASGTSMFRQYSPGLGANGSSVWISFLARVDEGAPGNAYALLAMPGGTQSATGVAFSLTRAGINDTFLSPAIAPYPGGGGGGSIGTTPVAFGETALLLARIDYRPGNELVSLWLNPRLDGPLGAPDVLSTMLDLNIAPPGPLLRIEQGSFRTSFIDEIRIGPSLEEVLPLVPGPGTGLALALGMASMGRRRGR